MKRRYVEAAFDGEGARQFGGRWNSPGRAAVYVSESRSLAALEVLAGLGAPAVMSVYIVAPVDIDEAFVTSVDVNALPNDWFASPPGPGTQSIGDEWLSRGTSAVLRVPSPLIPGEFNFVLNPAHRNFRTLVIGPAEELRFDLRLLPG